MEINVSVQYNGGLLPDIILLATNTLNVRNNNNNNCRPDVVTLGNPFDTMKRFCLYSQCSHLNL